MRGRSRSLSPCLRKVKGETSEDVLFGIYMK